jgi:hypothetical protein
MAQKQAVGGSQASCREMAVSVDDDMRSLRRTVACLLETETSDEALAHILNVKVAADRGLVLTKRLLTITEGQAGPTTAH